MGWNATVVVMCDSLDAIADDPEFGKKLRTAVARVSAFGKHQDIESNGHVNAATVIETHHANAYAVVAVGGNFGGVLGCVHDGSVKEPEDRVQLLRRLAGQLGYRLCLKPSRRSRNA